MAPFAKESRGLLLASIGLGLAAVLGWANFATVVVSSSHRVSALSAERDAAVAEREVLLAKSGDLAALEAKAALARAESSRAAQALAEVKAKTVMAQQELASVAKRLETPGKRVSQTGSIRQPEPPKRPAR
jgi:hypothetical protein